MLVVDIFSGTGAATQAFVDRGHKVIRIDNNPKLKPDIVADVRHLPLRCKPDFVWASPPCQLFSLARKGGGRADNWIDGLELVVASCDAIAHLAPRYWVIENVRGACAILGPGYRRFGSVFLWGRLPPFVDTAPHSKKMAAHNARDRARMPYSLSLALCLALERDLA